MDFIAGLFLFVWVFTTATILSDNDYRKNAIIIIPLWGIPFIIFTILFLSLSSVSVYKITADESINKTTTQTINGVVVTTLTTPSLMCTVHVKLHHSWSINRYSIVDIPFEKSCSKLSAMDIQQSKFAAITN